MQNNWSNSESTLRSFSPSPTELPALLTNSNQNKQSKIPQPPPIFILAELWWRAAPLVLNNPKISSEGLSAKSNSGGKIMIKTQNSTQFCLVQSTLLDQKIDFHAHSFAADRQLKLNLRGSTFISTDEL